MENLREIQQLLKEVKEGLKAIPAIADKWLLTNDQSSRSNTTSSS